MTERETISETDSQGLPAYAETCNTIRHYSNASLTVRVMSVVQGMALLGVWAVNLPKGEVATDVVVPLFGLLFTIFLFRFHIGYFKATEYFYKIATRMEKELFASDFRPFGEYDKCHTEWYATQFDRLTILHVPFTFIGLVCCCALLIGVVNHL